MDVKLTFNGEDYHAALSGSDLEVTLRLLAKFQKIRSKYIDGQYRMVMVEGRPELKAEVLTNSPLISEAEGKALEDAEQQGIRKVRVEEILETSGVARDEAIKALWQDMYYHSIITHNVWKAQEFAFEPGSIEHECVDFINGNGNVIRIEKDGSHEFFPAHSDV